MIAFNLWFVCYLFTLFIFCLIDLCVSCVLVDCALLFGDFCGLWLLRLCSFGLPCFLVCFVFVCLLFLFACWYLVLLCLLVVAYLLGLCLYYCKFCFNYWIALFGCLVSVCFGFALIWCWVRVMVLRLVCSVVYWFCLLFKWWLVAWLACWEVACLFIVC